MFYETILWLTIFIITVIASVAGLIYLITRLNKFSLIKKINIQNRFIRRCIAPVILLLFIVLMYFIFGYVNAIVILLNLTAFWIICDIATLILKALKVKIPNNIYYAGVAAITLTFIYLSVGWYLDHNVFATYYSITTDKDVTPLRIAQISDSHLGTTFDGEGFAKHLAQIQEYEPDVLLITGDYVDGGSDLDDIIVASKALGEFTTKYGTYFCFGNHDRNFYELNGNFTEAQLIDELNRNNIIILKDEYISLPNGYTILGREDASAKSRMSIDDLLREIDEDQFIIDMNHQPSDYDAEEASGVDMVLSGHTHGGQLFPVRNVGLIIGAVDKIYGLEKRSNTDFIVTSGISDWAIDFKTGCKSEFVIIDINR